MASSQQASSSNAPAISQGEPTTMDLKLFKALRNGRKDEVRELARQNGNRFPGKSQQGDTVLHIAARFGHKYAVMQILEHQHDLINELNQNNETPMHIAARTGNFGVVKMFMTHRNTANPELILRMKDGEENTPLHNAVRKCDCKMAFAMIIKDPEPIGYVNNGNQSPLSMAIDARLTYIACFMIEKYPSSLQNRGPNSLTLLQRAILKSDYVVVAKLLEAKRELINEVDVNKRNPLHYAAGLGHFEIACRLSDEDAKLAYERDCNDQTPLHLASKNGHLNILKMLLRSFPDSVELIDDKQRNILHLAAQNGHADIVVFILKLPEMEDLINSPDVDRNTPLLLAATHYRINVVSILARNVSVNIRATNNDNKTALEIVESSTNHGEMSKFLAIKALEVAYERQARYQYGILEHGRSGGTRTGNINVGPKNDEMAKTLLVMATLISTFTFTSAFTIPGSYNNKGMPNLIAEKGFKAFVITDTIAMTTSVTAAVLVFGHFFYRNVRDLSMKFITTAIVLVPIGLVSMLLAFTTGLFIVLTSDLTLAIAVCLIGFGLPILIFILISCFDGFFYLQSSSTSLMTGLDFVEIVDSFERLRAPVPTFFMIVELYVRLVFRLLIWMFIRLTLLVDPDDRNYHLSSSRFWIKVFSERYKYSSFLLFSGGQIIFMFDQVLQRLELLIPVVSRFFRRLIPCNSEQRRSQSTA